MMTTDLDRTTLNIGLIGYGYAGRTFHLPLIVATPGLSLTAVATRQGDAVKARLPDVETLSDPQALMARDDIDLIIVATPNATHAPLARAALRAGKSIVVDKPFTLDLAEARALTDLATRADQVLSVFHNRRWDSDFLGVSRAIAQGLVGEVRHFESRFDRFRPQVRDRWREQDGPGAGIWYDLGPHLVDQALVLFGLPKAVQADLAVQRADAKVDDWAHVVLRYDDRRVVLHADMLAVGGSARFTVHGERGSLRKAGPDQQEAQLLAGMAPGADDWGCDDDDLLYFDAEGRQTRVPVPAGDQRRFYAAVRDAVLGVGPNPVPPIQALAVMSVIAAAIESNRTGARCALALSDAERAQFQRSRGAARP